LALSSLALGLLDGSFSLSDGIGYLLDFECPLSRSASGLLSPSLSRDDLGLGGLQGRFPMGELFETPLEFGTLRYQMGLLVDQLRGLAGAFADLRELLFESRGPI